MDIWQGCPSKSYNQCWSGNMPIQNNLRYFGDAKETESFTQFTRLCLALWRQSEQLFRNETASATRQNPKFLYPFRKLVYRCTHTRLAKGRNTWIGDSQQLGFGRYSIHPELPWMSSKCKYLCVRHGTQIWYLDQIFQAYANYKWVIMP